MSILIRGKEVNAPECCGKCRFFHTKYDPGYCYYHVCVANGQIFNDGYDITKPHIDPYKEKLEMCPLVPVPPHGRLIDADALSDHMRKVHDDWKENGHYTIMTDDEIMVMYSPTIVEAEEGET